MTRDHEPQDEPRTPHVLYAATLLAAALFGFGAVYGIVGRADNGARSTEPVAQAVQMRLAQAPAAPDPGKATDTAGLPSGPGSNALSVGQMAAFVFKKTREPLPAFAFVDGTGRERTLADWKGKVVLINLWATWCIPCRKEMPGLDRLQAELGSDRFEVVAISADKKGIDGARQFLGQLKTQKLAVYADPSVRVTSTLKAIGMPASILVDAQGREIGRLVGPAEWDSPEAKALIAAALK